MPNKDKPLQRGQVGDENYSKTKRLGSKHYHLGERITIIWENSNYLFFWVHHFSIRGVLQIKQVVSIYGIRFDFH